MLSKRRESAMDGLIFVNHMKYFDGKDGKAFVFVLNSMKKKKENASDGDSNHNKKAKRCRNQHHTTLDFAAESISFSGQFIVYLYCIRNNNYISFKKWLFFFFFRFIEVWMKTLTCAVLKMCTSVFSFLPQWNEKNQLQILMI